MFSNITSIFLNLSHIVLPFITAAEATYPGQGTGADKQKWVINEVTQLATEAAPGINVYILGLVLPAIVNAAVRLFNSPS